jgi:hypothetical protein
MPPDTEPEGKSQDHQTTHNTGPEEGDMKTITLDDLDSIHLDNGSHDDPANGMCVMEAAALLAGDKFSDHPQCVSPVIRSFMISWNDALNDEDRQSLKQHLGRVLNTNTSKADEQARAWMATDWLVRVHTPAWLRLAGLDGQADTLEGLAPLDGVTTPKVLPVIKTIRQDAAAAWAAAGAAAGDAAGDAAGAAAWAAAGAAAGDAAGAAAWDAAWAAANGDYWAKYHAAKAAAQPIIEAEVKPKLREVTEQLQASAHELVIAMCEVGRD